jgi:hypothetical protein
MPSSPKTNSPSRLRFGDALAVGKLVALAAELQLLRDYPPLVKRGDGKYEGDILGFVKGLRLSAGVIYFLRERLLSTGLDVSWGQLLDERQAMCSPECDLIVHTPEGHVREWNGDEKPVMRFKFVKAGSARAVISCKSSLTAIDKDYPKALKKYGIKNVFLLAECCKEAHFSRLSKAAKKAGYKGLWCLYQVQKEGSPLQANEKMCADFGDAVLKAVKRRRRQQAR